MIKKPDFIKVPLKTTFFWYESIISKFKPSYFPKNEYGICNVCGNFTKFIYIPLFNQFSNEVKSCNWDEVFTENINLTNSLNCRHCYSKFRIRCTVDVLLKHFNSKSIKHLCKSNLGNTKILETGSVDSVFSNFKNFPNVVMSEYYDEVPFGEYKNGIRCEDLQKLTFDDDSFDVIISLDVFEHIPDPMKAFSEVLRVLKINGLAIITFPIDVRKPVTKTVAELKDGKLIHYQKPSYHSDPIRDEGSLVFTEFGTDIKDILTGKGYNADLLKYETEKDNGYQFVLTIRK